jgi:RNA polymerase sigma factor (sigma-70 family)
VEAEEVAQDAFVRAWKYAASFDARRGSVSNWLLGIVRNAALDRVRVAQRRNESFFAELPRDLLLDWDADASDAIAARDAARPVLGPLEALPVEQREALLLVTLNGLSAREVSDALQVPLGTVKTRIQLGLRKLRAELGAML